MANTMLLSILFIVNQVQGLKLQSTTSEKTPTYLWDTPTDISLDEIVQAHASLKEKSTRTCDNGQKWLYVRGDSTIRQVVRMMIAKKGQNMDDAQMKEHFRSQCMRPPHSPDYQKFMTKNKNFGAGTCYLNERRCDWRFAQSRVTYDWQHFVMEERENFLFNKTALSEMDHDFKDGMPDMMIMGLPVHPCAHTNPNPRAPKVKKDQAVEDQFKSQIPQLFEKVRSVYKGPIIWVEAGGVNHQPEYAEYMRCLTNMNTELGRVIKSDPSSRIIPRQLIESKYVSEHPDDVGPHKREACVEKVFNEVCSNMEV